MTHLRDVFREAALSRRTGTEDATRQAVLAYLASYRTGDIEARLALFAEDATFEDPVGTDPIIGREALKAFWAAGAHFDIAMELQTLAVNGLEAAFLFVATLRTQQGDAVTLRVIETLVVNEQGLISRMRAHFDSSSIT